MNLNFVMPQSNTLFSPAVCLVPSAHNTCPCWQEYRTGEHPIRRSLHAFIYIFVPGVFHSRGYVGFRGLHSFLPRGTRSQNWTLCHQVIFSLIWTRSKNWTLRHQVIFSPILAETVEDFLSTIEPCAIRWFFGSNFKDFPPGVDLTRRMCTHKAGLCFE